MMDRHRHIGEQDEGISSPAAPPSVAHAVSSRGRPDRLAAGYIFDLDGTIYLGEELLPGARRLIAALIALDRKFLFLSNNPTGLPEEYAAKLTRLGVPA